MWDIIEPSYPKIKEKRNTGVRQLKELSAHKIIHHISDIGRIKKKDKQKLIKTYNLNTEFRRQLCEAAISQPPTYNIKCIIHNEICDLPFLLKMIEKTHNRAKLHKMFAMIEQQARFNRKPTIPKYLQRAYIERAENNWTKNKENTMQEGLQLAGFLADHGFTEERKNILTWLHDREESERTSAPYLRALTASRDITLARTIAQRIERKERKPIPHTMIALAMFYHPNNLN